MKNKKKILAIVILGLLVVALVPAAIFASGNGYGNGQAQVGIAATTNIGNNYVDANGDGICDNHGTNCGNHVDANGDGICDNHGTNCGNYVDTNGDGVCDNYGTNGSYGHHGGRGMGHHNGGHHGCW